MKRLAVQFVLLLCTAASGIPAERINHAGRILGPPPVVTNAVLFNTAAADAILAAMQICPVDSPWNEDISRRPVLTNSDAMITQIGSDLSSSRRTLRAFQEMNFVLVPDAQPLLPINLFNWPEESDPSPYPTPPNLPVESWPTQTGTQTLPQWQQDVNGIGGDRHAIIVQPGAGFIWETWLTQLSGTNWEASNGAKFDLNSNAPRPAGWTSGDAAGLPMFPALPRYDECERGEIEHALRIVVKRTRTEYIYPARHQASSPSTNGVNYPAMGQRLRLKSGFNVPANWTKQEQAILRALKKYGALVADNGNFFSISVTPDDRWPAGCFDHLTTVGITNFEVISTTAPNEGPRSPNAPSADAGPDRTVELGQPVVLEGSVSHGSWSTTNRWSLYSGPSPLSLADATQTNTLASFSSPGTYTLMLSADDGVHAVAHDAVVYEVVETFSAAISLNAGKVTMTWSGGTPPFVIEQASSLNPPVWLPVLTNGSTGTTFPAPTASGFFRVRAQ